MNETISVDDAIKKGLYTVNLPALLIFSIGLIGSFCLAFVFYMPLATVAGIIFSAVLAIAYRTFMAAKWRIWAFKSVRNVHDLYERALTEKLIYPSSLPGFGIINYNSKAQKEDWEQLQAKFQHPDIFFDDQSIPAETVIRYSIIKKSFWTGIALIMTGFGIALYTLGGIGSYILGAVFTILGCLMCYLHIKALFNRLPQIIINNYGISTANTPFYRWEEISNEHVIREGSGKHASYYLCYDHPNGSSKFKLDDFNVGFRQLQRLFRIYRGRSENIKNS